MDMLEQILKDLEARRGEWPNIAKETGVSYSWLTKLAQRKISDPGIRRVYRLREVLDRKGA